MNAVDKQVAEVDCKGKIRTVFLDQRISRPLRHMQGRGNIGIRYDIRHAQRKAQLDRSNIWREMKQISRKEG